jgi:hypothetical protein
MARLLRQTQLKARHRLIRGGSAALVPVRRAAPPRLTGDAGRYSRSFGLSASIASPPCGEWKAYRVTAAIARKLD